LNRRHNGPAAVAADFTIKTNAGRRRRGFWSFGGCAQARPFILPAENADKKKDAQALAEFRAKAQAAEMGFNSNKIE